MCVTVSERANVDFAYFEHCLYVGLFGMTSCSVVQCVAVCCGVLQCGVVCYIVLQCAAVCRSIL